MARSTCILLAALCAQAVLSETEADNDLSLLQKGWKFDGALCKAVLSETEAENDLSLLQKGWKFEGEQSLESGAQHRQLPVVVVDLDAAPEIRWRNLTEYYRKLGVYPQALQKRKEDFSAEDFSLLEVLQFDEEYMREFRGIVASLEGELVDPEASIEHLKLSQLLSELNGPDEPLAQLAASLPYLSQKWFSNWARGNGCSGLLAAMPNGTVVHGRNMDFSGFNVEVNGRVMHYPDVTVEATFLRAGKPFVTAVQWPLSIGWHTAMRYDGWSFETNIRHHGKDKSYLAGMLRGSQGYKLPVRRIMETTADFETAVTELYNLNVMAPMYFIVAGSKPWEGAVITLDRGGVRDPSTPPVMRLGSAGPVLRTSQNHTGSWHIIQTNDDLNKPAIDDRRPTAEMRLLESTQDMVSPDWVYSNLVEPPLFNDKTVFTSVFVPSSGYHKTVVHFDTYRS